MSRDVESSSRDMEKADAGNAVLDDEDTVQNTSSDNAETTDNAETAQGQDANAPSKPAQAAWGSDAPDGGGRAWLVVLGCACTSFCTFGWLNSVGVFQEYYETTVLSQYSNSTVSWIPSLQVFFMMATGPLTGWLYDKHGPRYLLIIGTAMHVFGLMMASLATEYYQILLSQGVCSAIGVGFVYLPGINVIPGWFNKKRGAAYGALALGSSFGGIIFPIMISHIIPRLGFGWAMRISAFLILALLIVANLTIKAYHAPQPRPMSFESVKKPFTELPFVLLAVGLFFFTFSLYVPINYVAVEAQEAGMSPGLVQYLVPILNAGSVFGRIGSGVLSDKLGRYNIFTVVCYMAAILTMALWLPASNNAARIAFAALYGFFSGAYVSLIGALVAQISPLREIGFRTGLIFALVAIPGLTTSPIGGAILQSSSGWVGAKVFAGVIGIVGSSFVLLTRIRETGWKLAVIF